MARKRSRRIASEDDAAAVETPIPDEVVRDLSQIFKLLADETRLRLLLSLSQTGELNVGDMCGRLEQSQPAVSHHLALLRVAGMIESRREGKHNYYSLRPEFIGSMLEHLLTCTGQEIPRRTRVGGFVLLHDPR
jgi:ArsR family transcriptional regulator